ncbi:MAG TPA: YfiR family protein [Terriglobales bacterium]|nr:YfiR family protein [Terriglobales bacterium]
MRSLLGKTQSALACLLWAFSLVALLTGSYSQAQEQRPTESQVESAYLYNFGKFVTWPADHAAGVGLFEICVIGKDPFGDMLDATVNGETMNGKKIAIRRISSLPQAAECEVLFISQSEQGRLSTILDTAQRFDLLTVSNIKHFAEHGGIIGLVEQQDRIRFEVNRTAALRSHLILSSELLKVAVKVIEKGGPGS